MGPQSRNAAAAAGPRRHEVLPGRGLTLVRGCAGLLVLASLLVALPVGLLYGTLALAGAGGDPLGGGLAGLLSGPDQGQLFEWLLAVVGWLAWAAFALGLLVEVVARTGGRIPRRLPALGWSQRTAAALLGTVFALMPASGAFAAALPVPPSAVVATAPVVTGQAGAGATASSGGRAAVDGTTTPAAGSATVEYTVRMVRPAETLWSVAETRLGGGERWQEIARLNQGRVMDSAGTVFQADAALRPGWTLRLPAAPASPPVGTPGTAHVVEVADVTAAAGTAPAAAKATVHRGDTLSSIADEHHVPGGWQSVYTANRAVIGADPDLIEPGERLVLPGTRGTPATPGMAGKRSAADRAPARAVPPEPAPGAAVVPEPALLPAPPGAPTDGSTAASDAPAPATRAAHDDPVRLPAGGAGVVLATGLLGLLVRNRVRQQRRRPPRRRIPVPGAEEQQYEVFLRAMADPTSLDLLDRTLRTLGMACLDTGAVLPALSAVALRPGGVVDLHLVAPAPAVAPFSSTADGRVWRCRAAEAELIDVDRARDVPAPYPALVTLGRTIDGVQVLVDLEGVRHLHLDGSRDEVAAVNRALVAELAVSPLADRMRLVGLGAVPRSAGSPTEEDVFDTGRLSFRDHPEQALAELIDHRVAVERSLRECQVEHPRAARAQGVATELWIPSLLCTDRQLTEGQLDELRWLLAGAEHHCVAAVTAAASGPGWHVDARPGHHRLAGRLPFAVELQRLTEEEYAATLSILGTSRLPAEEPAPDWTGHDPEAEPEPDDPFVIPVLATRSRSTAGTDPASAVSVPLLDLDLPGAARRPWGDDRRRRLIPALTAGLALHLPELRPSSQAGRDGGGEGARWTPAPRVQLLGPVRIIGATEFVDPALTSRLTALAALLVTHPDPDPRLVDAILDPVPYAWSRPAGTGRSSAQARNAAFSGLSDWLGPAPDGEPCLDLAGRRLHPAVTCDWTDFRDLYRHGMNAVGPAEDAALRRALDLVRGGPFAGSHHLYPWAEPYRQDMISAIIDAAHELAKRCLAVGDHGGCEAALHSGLAAVPEAEILHRGLIHLYATEGLGDRVAATITRLAQVNDALGWLDYEPETLELFSSLSGRRHTR